MQLGFVSAILPELSLEEVFDSAAESGYDCVEAMCWPVGKAERKYAGVTHLDVAGFTLSRAQDVQALCAKHRVTLSALGYHPNLLDPDFTMAEAARTQLKKVIKAASLLGRR